MALDIIVEKSNQVDLQNPKEGGPVAGEHVVLIENDGRIEIHQNNRKIAEITEDKVDGVNKFEPLGATIACIKGRDHLVIRLLN